MLECSFELVAHDLDLIRDLHLQTDCLCRLRLLHLGFFTQPNLLDVVWLVQYLASMVSLIEKLLYLDASPADSMGDGARLEGVLGLLHPLRHLALCIKGILVASHRAVQRLREGFHLVLKL